MEGSENKEGPKRWHFGPDTDWESIDFSGLDFSSVPPAEPKASSRKMDLPSGISRREYDRLNDAKGFERMRADSIPKVKSRIPEVDGKIRVFSDVEGDRVVVKLHKEAKRAEFVGKELVLEPDRPEDVLVLKPETGAGGLVLGAKYPSKRFVMHHPIVTSQRLIKRNVRVNDEIVWNVTATDNIENIEPQRVVYFPESHKPFVDFEQDVTEVNDKLPLGGQLHVVTHKKQGAGRQKEAAEASFGEGSLVETRRGMGGYRLYTLTKIDDQPREIGGERRKFTVKVLGHRFPVETGAGLFSTKELDRGTELLLETSGSDIEKSRRLLDVGSGWGAITIASALHNPKADVYSVDVDPKAVEVTKGNVKSLRISGQVHVGLTHDPSELVKGVDLVLSNPPFHENTGVLIDLFSRTRKAMKKGAKVRIVVENSYAPKFEGILERTFGGVSVSDKNDTYTILESFK